MKSKSFARHNNLLLILQTGDAFCADPIYESKNSKSSDFSSREKGIFTKQNNY